MYAHLQLIETSFEILMVIDIKPNENNNAYLSIFVIKPRRKMNSHIFSHINKSISQLLWLC